MSDRVELEIKGPVAYVRLNRPEKHNGMDFALLKAVVKTAQQLKKNRDIRAVLLSGNGPSFCSGLDVKAMFADPKRMARRLPTPAQYVAVARARWRSKLLQTRGAADAYTVMR